MPLNGLMAEIPIDFRNDWAAIVEIALAGMAMHLGGTGMWMNTLVAEDVGREAIQLGTVSGPTGLRADLAAMYMGRYARAARAFLERNKVKGLAEASIIATGKEVSDGRGQG